MFRIRVLQSQYLWLQQIRQTVRVCCGHGGRRVLVQFWAVITAAEHQNLGSKHCTKPEHPQRCAFRAAFFWVAFFVHIFRIRFSAVAVFVSVADSPVSARLLQGSKRVN